MSGQEGGEMWAGDAVVLLHLLPPLASACAPAVPVN